MCTSKSMASKLSLSGIKNLIAQFRKPTTPRMKALKYLGLAGTGGLLFYRVAWPAYKDYRFYKYEALANEIYGLEVKHKES